MIDMMVLETETKIGTTITVITVRETTIEMMTEIEEGAAMVVKMIGDTVIPILDPETGTEIMTMLQATYH